MEIKNKGLMWKFAVDSGGTFTDIVAVDPKGDFHTHKLLSNSPEYNDASVEGIRRVLNLNDNQPLPIDTVEKIRLGSTKATNALLEKKGSRTALLITKGFADLLEIGYQERPDIFSVCVKKTLPVYSEVIEVDERVGQDGKVIRKIALQSLEKKIRELENIDTIAVVFMHSWKNPIHEIICEKFLRKHGFLNTFLSHKTVNLIKIVSRGNSTVIDAYLGPVIKKYLDGIKKNLTVPIEFMESSGGICKASSFKGKNAILSGPAGGAIAVGKIAEELGLGNVIGFDMGGTSTDISRYDGKFEKVYCRNVEGMELQTEMLNIATIASGGGSILWFDGQKMRVGPESAGAYPGPACYGFGGPLTVTDANLVTGRIIPEYFPKTFGANRNSPLDIKNAQKKLAALTEEINNYTKVKLSNEETAIGFLRIANEKMATAIKEISVSKGFDVRNYALICFGGAGGQHACEVARLLEMEKIIFHPLSGLMSAYGIGISRQSEKQIQTVLKIYTKKLHKEISAMFEKMKINIVDKNKYKNKIYIKRELDLRPKGSDTSLTIIYNEEYEETVKNFIKKYEELFGFAPELIVEVVNLRLEIQEVLAFFPPYKAQTKPENKTDSLPLQKIYYQNLCSQAPVYKVKDLSPRSTINGPAILIDDYSTLVVERNFKASVEKNGVIALSKVFYEKEFINTFSGKADPALLEIFNNIFMSVSNEMGYTLKNTSHSVNIKDRMDFSCAVFDSEGELVANAPHIPVHLGSMSDTVKGVIEVKGRDMESGDIYLTNNPYRGGSHLPDMTVVCPIFSKKRKLLFFIASRGHHADIGGIIPGSIPPYSKHIDEEGVLIDSFLLVRNGVFKEGKIKEVLSSHKYPARNINERISDLNAQIASCCKGAEELQRVIKKYGWKVTNEYMGYIRDNAEYAVKQVLKNFLNIEDPFEKNFTECLDDGTELKVKITIKNFPEGIRSIIDFSGTGEGHNSDNLNAPVSVTRSAVLYVLRLLTETDIPLNSGCLAPIDIIIPENSILSPKYPQPVASGNVETSQRIVDLLLGALGTCAASQGTMNNFVFEMDNRPYYETIGGGSGATNGCSGASGVQVHMTNTRITDPEILEFRYPDVILERFAIRKNSGGRGMYNGGNGLVREVKFLKTATVSIISERRRSAPYGMAGGKAGRMGVNILKRATGKTSVLPHRFSLEVSSGDSIIIATPGGGGFGRE